MLTSDLNGFLYAKSYSEISVLIPFHKLLDFWCAILLQQICNKMCSISNHLTCHMSQTFCQILSLPIFLQSKEDKHVCSCTLGKSPYFVSLILFVRLNSPNLHVSSVSLTFHCIPPNFLANNSAISSNKRRGVGFPYQSQRFSYPFFHPSQFGWRFSCTAYILL